MLNADGSFRQPWFVNLKLVTVHLNILLSPIPRNSQTPISPFELSKSFNFQRLIYGLHWKPTDFPTVSLQSRWVLLDQDCSRHERRARQKHNEQVRKHFDAQERWERRGKTERPKIWCVED